MVCKTVKKGLVGAGLGALTLGLLFGTSAPSYVRTAVHKVRETADKNVPIEFKVAEAEQQVAALEPAIKGHIETLARAEVEVKDLQTEIQLTQTNLDEASRELLTLNDALKSGRTLLTSGTPVSADEVKADLTRRFDQYRRGKETLKSKQDILKIKLENVKAIRAALDEMKTARKTLEVQIEAAKTRLAQIEATQATNQFTYDDTPLSRAKETIADLNKQLDVLTRQAELEGQYVERGVATAAADPSRDIAKEIEAEFAPKAESADSQGL